MLTYKSDLSAHVLRACGLYLCMISSLLYRLHKGGVAHAKKYIFVSADSHAFRMYHNSFDKCLKGLCGRIRHFPELFRSTGQSSKGYTSTSTVLTDGLRPASTLDTVRRKNWKRTASWKLLGITLRLMALRMCPIFFWKTWPLSENMDVGVAAPGSLRSRLSYCWSILSFIHNVAK